MTKVIGRVLIGLGVAAAAMVATIVVLIAGNVVYDIATYDARMKQKEAAILATDPVALRDACRWMMDNRATLPPDTNWSGGDYIDPKSSVLPAVVRELEPTTVLVEDDSASLSWDRVIIVEALRDDDAQSDQGIDQLTAGLWYAGPRSSELIAQQRETRGAEPRHNE